MKATFSTSASAIAALAAAAAIALPRPASATHTKDHVTKTKIVAAADFTAGEVRKVDKSAGKITLKHEAIKNLDMPGMTMVFPVKDPALLDTVQSGDKVKFRAEKSGSGIVVTELEPAK